MARAKSDYAGALQTIAWSRFATGRSHIATTPGHTETSCDCQARSSVIVSMVDLAGSGLFEQQGDDAGSPVDLGFDSHDRVVVNEALGYAHDSVGQAVEIRLRDERAGLLLLA